MLAKIIIKLMAPAFQKSLKFNHLIINYGRICFMKLDNEISLQEIKPFLPFLDTKPFYAMKMTNHHDKQLTSSKSWDQDGFFEPGYGYHQLQIIGLEFL